MVEIDESKLSKEIPISWIKEFISNNPYKTDQIEYMLAIFRDQDIKNKYAKELKEDEREIYVEINR